MNLGEHDSVYSDKEKHQYRFLALLGNKYVAIQEIIVLMLSDRKDLALYFSSLKYFCPILSKQCLSLTWAVAQSINFHGIRTPEPFVLCLQGKKSKEAFPWNKMVFMIYRIL